MKVPIADSLFLQYGRTAKLGGGNEDVFPTYFEWELADPESARFVTDPFLKHARGPGQVALLLESFFLHPETYLAAMQVPFDHVLTHNIYFAKHKGWLWYPAGGSFVAFENWGIHEKSKDVSILLSPKKQIWGHKMFNEAAEKYAGRLDVFGLDHHTDKMEAIAPYRFTVIVEGEITDSYFSEKLIDCFALGTIPIYWGCPNIGNFFDARGMFLPENMAQIGEAIGYADSYAYDLRLRHAETNLELAKEFRIPEDWIYTHYPFLFEEKK